MCADYAKTWLKNSLYPHLTHCEPGLFIFIYHLCGANESWTASEVSSSRHEKGTSQMQYSEATPFGERCRLALH